MCGRRQRQKFSSGRARKLILAKLARLFRLDFVFHLPMSCKRGSFTARTAETMSGSGLSANHNNFDLLVGLTEHAVYGAQQQFRSIEGRYDDGNEHP
jgi:hypothetical protein